MNLIKSIRWSFTDQILSQGILILFNIFFTHHLSVSDIGFWAILTSVNGISNIILDAGFSAALIQSESVSMKQYKTVFIVNVAISFIIYFLCFFSASFVGKFLSINDSNFNNYFQIYSIGIVLNGLISVPKIILMRRLEFKKLAIINLISCVFSVLVGVILILNEIKFYSLIIQLLISLTIQFIFYIFYNSEFLKSNFEFSSISNLFKYGNRLFISALLDNVYLSIYNFFLARTYSLSSLGYFNRAKYLHDVPNNAFSLIFLRVLFPYYAKTHNDKGKLIELHKLLITLIIFLVSIPVLFVLIFSKEIVQFIFGQNFSYSSIILSILILNIPFYIVDSLNLTLIKAIGRSDLFLKLEIQKKTAAAILISIAIISKNIFFLYLVFPLGGFISVLMGVNVTHKIYNENMFARKTIVALFLIILISILCYVGIDYFQIIVFQKILIFNVIIIIFYFLYSIIFKEMKNIQNLFKLIKHGFL